MKALIFGLFLLYSNFSWACNPDYDFNCWERQEAIKGIHQQLKRMNNSRSSQPMSVYIGDGRTAYDIAQEGYRQRLRAKQMEQELLLRQLLIKQLQNQYGGY